MPYISSFYQNFWKKKDFCCFGYMTQSLLHSFVNWQAFVGMRASTLSIPYCQSNFCLWLCQFVSLSACFSKCFFSDIFVRLSWYFNTIVPYLGKIIPLHGFFIRAFSNGHISAMDRPIDFAFDPNVGFSGMADRLDLLPVSPNPRWWLVAILENFEWPYLRTAYITKLMVMWPMISLVANGDCSRKPT